MASQPWRLNLGIWRAWSAPIRCPFALFCGGEGREKIEGRGRGKKLLGESGVRRYAVALVSGGGLQGPASRPRRWSAGGAHDKHGCRQVRWALDVTMNVINSSTDLCTYVALLLAQSFHAALRCADTDKVILSLCSAQCSVLVQGRSLYYTSSIPVLHLL